MSDVPLSLSCVVSVNKCYTELTGAVSVLYSVIFSHTSDIRPCREQL